jgi:hypothetical protein
VCFSRFLSVQTSIWKKDASQRSNLLKRQEMQKSRFIMLRMDQTFPAPKFRGYGAAPLKRLHVRPADTSDRSIIKELSDIADKEGIALSISDGDQFYSDPQRIGNELRVMNENAWVQDDIFFKDGARGPEVLTLDKAHPAALKSGESVAKTQGMPFSSAQTLLEGGNFFKIKGPQRFQAIVGRDTLHAQAKVLALAAAGISVDEAWENGIKVKARPFYVPAAEQIGADLGVLRQDVLFIPQPEFHIDLGIRPLDGNTVLLNDPDCCFALLKEARSRSRNNPKTLSQIDFLGKRLQDYLKYRKRKGYGSTAEIERKLQRNGYRVIRIPGIFNCSTRNEFEQIDDTQGLAALFTNALVHQREDGSLAFITNRSPIPVLNKLFEEELKRKCREKNIEIHWVGGEEFEWEGNTTNQISFNLAYAGGIHCLVAEEPDFEKWRKIRGM